MFEFSHSYYRFPDEIENRIDVLYSDAIFDDIFSKMEASRYSFVPISNLADICRDSRDPRLNPDAEFLYVDIGSIDTNSGLSEPIKMLGAEATSARMRRVIREGNILVSTTRPTRNAITIVTEDLDNQICSTGFVVVNPKNAVNTKFLFYALRAKYANLQFERLCSGSGYPAINQETDFPRLLVPNLSEPEQIAIVDVIEPLELEAHGLEIKAKSLRSEANEYLLEALDLQVPENTNYFFRTAAEKQTLTFTLFPSDLSDRLNYLFYHPRFALLQELKAKYQTTSLQDICTKPITRGEQPDYDENGEIIVIKTIDLKNYYIDYDNALSVSEQFFNSKPSAQLSKGDILLASTGFGSLGKVDIYDREAPAMVDGHIAIIRVNEDYDSSFVAYFLRSPLGQLQIEKYWTGSSGQIELQTEDAAKIILPSVESISKDQQAKIANEISSRIHQTASLEQEAKKTRKEALDTFESLIF